MRQTARHSGGIVNSGFVLRGIANSRLQTKVNWNGTETAIGIPHYTIHANNFHFYEEIHEVLEMEPNEALDPETLGLFASIGLEKGKPFVPDERIKKILTEAAAVGNATARALTFRSRNQASYLYPGSS